MADFTPILVEDENDFVPQSVAEDEDDFVPQSVAEDEDDFVPQLVADPTLGEIGAGIGTEIGVGIGGQLAGTAIGTAILPGVGTAIGYTVGSIGSGIAGSIAAQKIEGQEDISWGRAISAGLINLVPGGGAKGVTGATKITGAIIGKAALREGAKGAAMGATEATSRAIIDEGRLPTKEELAQYGGAGALFGGAMGSATPKISKTFDKLFGKTAQQIDDDIASGVISAKELKELHPEMPDSEIASTIQNIKARSTSDAAAAEIIKAQEIAAKGRGTFGKIFASLAPSKVVGRKSQQAAIDFGRSINEADELGSKIARNLEKKIGGDEAMNKLVNRMLDGDIIELTQAQTKKLGSSLADIAKYQEMRLDQQKKMLSLLEEGAYKKLDEDSSAALQEAIKESLGGKSYNRREYKIFLDPKFVEDPKLEKAAFDELSIKMGPEKAKAHMDKLRNASAATRDADPRSFFGAPVDSVLRKRHNPSKAERAWLGEVTEAPERIRGTLSGMGRSVARAEADSRITRSLLEDGIASKANAVGLQELVLRGTGAEGTGVYVNPEVQIALNNIYLPNADKGTENIVINALQDLYRASVAGSKAAKVLLNTIAYPVQLYGNTTTLLGMGVNPFSKSAITGARVAGDDVPILRQILNSLGGNTPAGRKALLDEVQEMSKYGIKNANILDSDLRNTLDNGIFSKMLSKVTDPLGKAYSVPDTMGRYVGWKANQKTLRKLFPNASDELIKREAAHLINDTYQNYDKLSNVVRTLSRWGVMPQFASFTAEFARNQYNQGKVIAKMLAGSYRGIENMGQANIGAMRREGAKRLAALTAVYGATYGAIEGVKSASGLGQEDQDALRDLAYAPWDKNREQMVKYDKKTRKGWTANPSYIVPHAIGLSALKAGMRGDDEASVIGMLQEELIGEGSFIMLEAFRAIENRDKNGNVISNEKDDIRNAADRIKSFMAESFRPGVSRELKKAAQAKRGVGDLTLKQVGQRQLGLRYNAFDVNQSAMFAVKNNYEPAKNEALKYYSLQKYENPSPQELQAAYEQAERINQESFNALVQNKQSMSQLDFTENEIAQTMKDARIPSATILSVLDGNYKALPMVKLPSVSETYDNLDGTMNEKRSQIMDIMKDDRELGIKLIKAWEREKKSERAGVTTKDSLISGLDEMGKVAYIRSQPNPSATLRDLQRKRLVNESVVRAVRLAEGQ